MDGWRKWQSTKPRKKGGALKILLVVLVLLVLAAGAALLLAKREIDGSGEQEEAVTVEIAQGSGVSTIAKKLQEAGVIRFPQLFRWYVGRDRGRGGKAPVRRIFAGARQLLR